MLAAKDTSAAIVWFPLLDSWQRCRSGGATKLSSAHAETFEWFGTI